MKKAAILAAVLLFLVASLGSCRYSPMKQIWTPKSYKKQPNRTPSAYRK